MRGARRSEASSHRERSEDIKTGWSDFSPLGHCRGGERRAHSRLRAAFAATRVTPAPRTPLHAWCDSCVTARRANHSKTCQAPNQKYSASRCTPNHPYNSAIPRPQEGRIAIVTDVGCGERWPRHAGRATSLRRVSLLMSEGRAPTNGVMRTAKPCGSGARCWRQAGGDVASPTGLCRIFNPPATEAKGIRLRGERGISRKPIAQGMPGCSGCTCMLVCALSSAICTRDRGCQPAPGIPCALLI